MKIAMTKTVRQVTVTENQRLVQADTVVPQNPSLPSWSAE